MGFLANRLTLAPTFFSPSTCTKKTITSSVKIQKMIVIVQEDEVTRDFFLDFDVEMLMQCRSVFWLFLSCKKANVRSKNSAFTLFFRMLSLQLV